MKQRSVAHRPTSILLEPERWNDNSDPYEFPLSNDMAGLFGEDHRIESDMDPGEWGDPDNDRVPPEEPLDDERI